MLRELFLASCLEAYRTREAVRNPSPDAEVPEGGQFQRLFRLRFLAQWLKTLLAELGRHSGVAVGNLANL